MPDTATSPTPVDYPERAKLLDLIEESRRLASEVDAAAVAALHEHCALHYPDATTLVLDSNGNPDEYMIHGVLTGNGSPAKGNGSVFGDDELMDVVRNLPSTTMRYDRNSRLWYVALR